MPTKQKTSRRAPRKPEHMSERAMRKALRDIAQNAEPSPPAPPGTVPPARWVSVRQAAQWRCEIERDRKAGRPLPDLRKEGVLTLRRFAAHEFSKLNDICLMPDLTLGRFIGVAEDEDDFYYVVERLGMPEDQRRMYWSAVGVCDSLRGHTRAAVYEEIEKRFRLNGCKPVRRMLILRASAPRGILGTRGIRTPINMTGGELLAEMRGVLRGEREGPRARGKTRRKSS